MLSDEYLRQPGEDAGELPILDAWELTCPLPVTDAATISMAHGSGGSLTSDLIKSVILPHFKNPLLEKLNDQAVFDVAGVRIAFTTDSYVVSPIFFPGGDIGRLAVNGTVNDLAMSGAVPLHLSVAFIIEEGFARDDLEQVVRSMSDAAAIAGVTIVTGDTKVVERGHGDGIFVTTSGVGLVPPGLTISADHVEPGDVVLVSGGIAQHGMAVLARREGLDFDAAIESDTAALNGLVQSMLAASTRIHALRDPTRGGLASTLNEIAQQSGVAIRIDEESLPIQSEVESLCEILGLDPLYVANEGKLIAFVAADSADDILAAMRAHPLGRASAIIGRAEASPPGLVTLRTCVGGTRVIDVPAGEQLPRIC